MNVLNYAIQKMKEIGQEHYHVETDMVTIRPKSTKNYGENNTYYFTANFKSDDVVRGFIDNSLGTMSLENHFVNSEIAKIRAFKGVMTITNNGNQMLYIEMLRVIPLHTAPQKL